MNFKIQNLMSYCACVIIILISMTSLTSCFLGGGGDSDPCEDVTCNEPYEVPVETASTVCQCQCAPGFTGPDCTEIDHGNCDVLHCQNGGTKKQYEDYCYCECPPDFGGELCEIPLVECAGIECPDGQSPDPGDECQCK